MIDIEAVSPVHPPRGRQGLYKGIKWVTVRARSRASKGDGYHGYLSQALSSCERRGHRTSRSALSMLNEHSNKDTRRLLCPSCAQVMRLARTTSRFENLPDLYIFECRACGL